MRLSALSVLNVAALLLGTSGVALAQTYPGQVEPAYDWAEVVRVEPMIQVVEQPVYREQCWDEPVTYREPDRYVRHHQPRAPAVVGGLIGGVVGNQFGHGRGRDAATAAGALLGYNLVRDSQSGYYQQGHIHTRHERRCAPQTEYQRHERINGYEVTYNYQGRLYQTITEHPPGPHLQVRVDVSPVR